jgi:hypothetical protein
LQAQDEAPGFHVEFEGHAQVGDEALDSVKVISPPFAKQEHGHKLRLFVSKLIPLVRHDADVEAPGEPSTAVTTVIVVPGLNSA